MKKSVVFGVLSKSPRFGSRIMVNSCSARSMIVNNSNNNVAVCNLLQIHNGQKNPFKVVEQLKCFHNSGVAQRSDESDSDLEYSSKDQDIDSDVEDLPQEHRRFLYPDSQDRVILKLCDCASVQAVFDIFSQYENEFSGQHASQALLVLWDLQKIYYKINKETHDKSDVTNPFTNLIEEYCEKVVSHVDFSKIVNCIECTLDELSSDAITCSFLYLKRMGIPFHSPVMQKLLLRIEELLENERSAFPITALSRFTVALKETNSLNFVFSVQKVLPLIYDKIDSCESENDFHLFSICLQNISWLISPMVFNAYKCKVEELITNDILRSFNTSVIIRIASFFNNPRWYREQCDLNRKLLLLLKGRITELKTVDVVKVHKIIENHLEPADLQAELSQHASHLLSEEGFTLVENEPFELLTCIASSCPPKKRKALEDITYNYLKQKLNPMIIASLFKVLRYLKTSNIELCDEFWSKTLQVMKAYPVEYSHLNIVKYSNRYMFFNNNLGGTYRHYEFENQLIEWYLCHYETGVIGCIPSKFSQMMGYLVAYCDNQQKYFFDKLEDMATRLDEMSSQLRAQDCTHISRGIQLSFLLGNKVYDKPHMYNIYVKLNSVLNRCIHNHMNILGNSLPITNTLMRSYAIRKAPQTTDISQSLVARYENFNGSINSRSLREAVHNFLASKCLIPKTIDYLTEFVAHNGEHLFGETVELILFACYIFGYTPANVDSFLKVASEVIIRESERISGLSVLQSCLALCFFHSLPEELVHIVFTIDFLERLDGEIANCYAKATYPSRIRNYLMQLNRAVCLDYPEFDVPWFHKKYCEEISATDVVPTSVFHNEVKETLLDVLEEKSFVRTQSYSPYGYKLDFEIFLNKHNIPVSWKKRSDKNIFRKAILLHTDELFSNNVKSLNGLMQMKKRHLEMLGYEVIEVEQTNWNSMYMAEPGMKRSFIREKLFKNESEVLRNRLV